MIRDNFIYDNNEYTLVDVYNDNENVILQYDSDDDILLFLKNNENIRRLTPAEEEEFRKKNGLVDTGYVSASVKDVFNGYLYAKKIDDKTKEEFIEFFKSLLYRINSDLVDSPYINKRLNALSFKTANLGASSGIYDLLNTIYLSAYYQNDMNSWVPAHETIHGIVNKSGILSKGIVEGIDDNLLLKAMQDGNYSQKYSMYNEEIDGFVDVQFNFSNMGQVPLILFAKQLDYSLGEDYDLHEMLTEPHKQINKFGEKYGQSNKRIFLHKVNKTYNYSTLKSFMDTQDFMLRTVFDKKFEMIEDEDTMKMYFEELIEFGLLRGRVNGKDEYLNSYYNNKKEELEKKSFDTQKIPEYEEKEFYQSGEFISFFDSYIDSCIELKQQGKGEDFQIFFNTQNTSAYIFRDGKVDFFADYNRKRKINKTDFEKLGFSIEQIENGNYLITGPDTVTEEVWRTNADQIIESHFSELGEKESKVK